ncbi:MAG: bifunctional UDP-3-O-[3-hydroxymyristoyl] N-acetylglucosamine deacetylase/3-hydroxyacyl-ACP dehydratase [Flavobacteriales bacterium]|nr:bifunctional UDP-3-O-[3-hydroxymyristoyl] N-acetylglucosamine deacetylase/3-hydroxyacyl-ACP dehydratase [Flavobacteriales bacterium]
MSAKQKTLANSFEVSGQGLHTGGTVKMRFLPADENTGLIFRRTDLEGNPEIKALADWVIDTQRGTTIGKGDVKIHTVEHALSALTGLEIDNCIMEIDGSEVPILDGSSGIFTDLIHTAGIKEQNAWKDYFVIRKPIRYVDPETGSEIMALPSDQYELTVMIDFGSKALGSQFAKFEAGADYSKDIARSRTFVFLHELEMLIKHGLIKGGDLSNAIVFVERFIDEKVLDKLKAEHNLPDIRVREGEMLNREGLRFSNEPARHKLLDVIGDLALVGVPIKGHIIATKPGHKVNTAFAAMLRDAYKKERASHQMPDIDLNKPPLYDIYQILNILPHRYPFLLVDKVIEMGDEHVVGVKNVTFNEPFFQGHFPDNPVMPGVMLIEAMAQVGGILVMNTVDDPKMYTPYFIKIDGVKFKRKVSPGDTVVFICHLVSPIRRGICHMEGKAYVDGKVVMEGEMMAQIIKNEDAK